MAKCIECGNAMTKTAGDHVYRESGLDNVVLRNITRLECPSCGTKSVEIPAMKQLHRAIARAIARKPARLETQEVRFLRDHLGLTNTEFAALMGVSVSQASRWTTTEPIGAPAERFLRLLATLGPELVASGIHGVDEFIAAKRAQEAIDDVAALLSKLPPASVEARPVEIDLRKASSGWKQEVAGAN